MSNSSIVLVSLVFGILNAGSVGGLCLQDDSTTAKSDWPDFLGPQRNGHSPETGLRFDWTERTPPLLWSFRIGEGYGSGTVADACYYHFDRIRDEERVTCLDAESGELKWQTGWPTSYVDMYGFDGGPRASPVVRGGRVFAFGAEGKLYCLDARSGDTVWHVDTAQRFGVVQNFFGVGSTPLVWNDLLIVIVGGSPHESGSAPPRRLDQVTPSGSGIVAFDVATGDVRYQSIDDLASYASPVVATINGRETCLALMRSKLWAFDPANGNPFWSYPFRATKLESVNASTPVVTKAGILITESYGPGGALLPLLTENGDEPNPLWADNGRRDARLACHWNTPVVIDDYAWASSGEKKSAAELRCIRIVDGEVCWSTPRLGRCSLIAADGHLICLSEDGLLLAIRPDPDEMAVVGAIQPRDLGIVAPCWAAPAIANGRLYLRDAARVSCLDIRATDPPDENESASNRQPSPAIPADRGGE